MSTSREVTVWCDVGGCTEWTAYGEPNATVARATAGRFGWRYVGKRDLCPKHARSKDSDQ